MLLGEPKYNYLIREGSTTGRRYSIDFVEVKEKRFNFIKEKYPNLKEICEVDLYRTAIDQFIKIPDSEIDVKKRAIKVLNNHYICGMKYKKLSYKEKIMLTFLKISPSLYNKISKFIRK